MVQTGCTYPIASPLAAWAQLHATYMGLPTSPYASDQNRGSWTIMLLRSPQLTDCGVVLETQSRSHIASLSLYRSFLCTP